MDLNRGLVVTEYEDCVGIQFNQAYLVIDKSRIDELRLKLKPYRQTLFRRLVKWVTKQTKYQN
jgi:hypothetical protein